MDDYSHCHLWDYERECIAITCDDRCRYFSEWEEQKDSDVLSDLEDLFSI